ERIAEACAWIVGACRPESSNRFPLTQDLLAERCQRGPLGCCASRNRIRRSWSGPRPRQVALWRRPAIPLDGVERVVHPRRFRLLGLGWRLGNEQCRGKHPCGERHGHARQCVSHFRSLSKSAFANRFGGTSVAERIPRFQLTVI